jgi:hypothetical protein
MKQREYIHFLRYDQDCLNLIMYGYIDLYYSLQDSTLYIKKVDHRRHTEKEIEFILEKTYSSTEKILEDFLINLMSYRMSFDGEPIYVESKIFSKRTFNKFLKKGHELMKKKDELDKISNVDNELIKYCESIGLNPEPEGGSPSDWRAKCPSGRPHFIMISTESNQWGCGYCRKYGSLSDLKKWYESNKK